MGYLNSRSGQACKMAASVCVLAAILILTGRADGQIERAAWSSRVPLVAGAKQYFISPTGRAENSGSQAAPWDLASALSGRHVVAPGDVLWVRGGTYKGKFEVKLVGKPGAPVHVRAVPGERATILDSTFTVVEPATYVWLWDLEIAGSVPVEKRQTQQTGSHPTDLPGGDGLNIYAGTGCKFIDLVIHDNVGGGIGWWTGSTDSEIYGCLIYNNGWRAPDRGHGHCIYAQNKDGLKTIAGCILSVPYEGSYTIHAYGSSQAYVDHFRLFSNVAYSRGPFLIGGGRPSRDISVLSNYLHGVDMQLGYGAENEDCDVRGNIIARGALTIRKFKSVSEKNNVRTLPERETVLILNWYDPSRAHLVVYNGARAASVDVDVVSQWLNPDESFRLMDPKDVYGRPVLQGRYKGGSLKVPVPGEFAVFVLLKDTPKRPGGQERP